MSVVELTDTATERELRKLRQRVQELEHAVSSLAYLRENLTPFDPAEHPMIEQAIATREALLLSCRCRRAA